MKVTLYLKPCAKARPRVPKVGKAYMPKSYQEWRARFCQLWHNCVPPMAPYNETMSIETVFVTPTGRMRPDADNAHAAVLDALQDCRAITNDNLVLSGTYHTEKRVKGQPPYAIRITITALACSASA